MSDKGGGEKTERLERCPVVVFRIGLFGGTGPKIRRDVAVVERGDPSAPFLNGGELIRRQVAFEHQQNPIPRALHVRVVWVGGVQRAPDGRADRECNPLVFGQALRAHALAGV
jgi:hypothetical protein